MWVTSVYADTEAHRIHNLWNELRSIGRGRLSMTMCLGDFNNISHHHEKEGGRRKSQRLIDAFNSMIEDIRMENLSVKGQPFTLSNNISE